MTEASPAWLSGLRSGDCILEINEWRISLMDRPEVMLASHWSPVASLVSCAPLRLWCMWPESPALTAHTLELRTLHDVP